MKVLVLLIAEIIAIAAPPFVLEYSPLIANITKWSNTLKQFVGKLPTNCLSVFDHFEGLALKGLKATGLVLL